MKKVLVSIIATIIIFSSCKEQKKSSALLTNVTGKSGEVILVIDPDQWSSDAGEQFRKKLSQEHPALPQREPMFDLIHIPYEAFTSIFKTHRNIILAKVDRNLHEPKMVVQEDVWAKPQIIINVLAPSDSALAEVIREKGDILVDRILRKEISRYAKNNEKYDQIEVSERLKRKFGIKLTVPQGYSLDVDTTNFVWIESKGRGDMVQGVLIYSYDKPDNELTTNYIFDKRTEFTKKFVPGPVPKSYMAVEREAIPYRREIKVNGIDVIEIRNLWKMENDFMGGPFINFTLIDESNKKVINIDGFVFAPKFDKRDYLRQVEAILNSVKMP